MYWDGQYWDGHSGRRGVVNGRKIIIKEGDKEGRKEGSSKRKEDNN